MRKIEFCVDASSHVLSAYNPAAAVLRTTVRDVNKTLKPETEIIPRPI